MIVNANDSMTPMIANESKLPMVAQATNIQEVNYNLEKTQNVEDKSGFADNKSNPNFASRENLVPKLTEDDEISEITAIEEHQRIVLRTTMGPQTIARFFGVIEVFIASLAIFKA